MLKIPPDHTFLLQILLFAVLWFGLKRLLFDPMVRLLEERERRTTGARQEAQRITATAEDSGAEYERRLQEIRHALMGETTAAHDATLREEQRILNEARDHAGTQLTQLRDNLNRLAEAARPVLGAEADQLAGRMVERIAGRAL